MIRWVNAVSYVIRTGDVSALQRIGRSSERVMTAHKDAWKATELVTALTDENEQRARLFPVGESKRDLREYVFLDTPLVYIWCPSKVRGSRSYKRHTAVPVVYEDYHQLILDHGLRKWFLNWDCSDLRKSDQAHCWSTSDYDRIRLARIQDCIWDYCIYSKTGAS